MGESPAHPSVVSCPTSALFVVAAQSPLRPDLVGAISCGGLIGHVLEFANPRVREDRERAVAQLKKRLEEKTARCIELEGERDHARAETEAAQELLAEAAQESERKLADLRSEVEDLTSH